MQLSIVIPTYSRNDSVVQCVKAVSHNAAEIIVVDDGSPEPVVVPDTARVIRHDRNRGQAAARNTGLRAATHDLVLLLDDDVFATPGMISRLLDEYMLLPSPEIALVGRVIWHPNIPPTLTMRWLQNAGLICDISSEQSGPLPNLSSGNTLLWRPFVLKHGGFDEHFTRYGVGDVELGLRLKKHGLQVQLVASALGYHHKMVRVRELVQRQFDTGVSAVYLHSKFPAYVPQVDDLAALLRNENLAAEAAANVADLTLLEDSGGDYTSGVEDLFNAVHRHHFLRGIYSGLRDADGLRARKHNSNTLAIYNHAWRLENLGELDEARRLFNLVLHRHDEEYWAGAHYHLGCIEEALANPQRAQLHLVECTRLNPGHRQAQQLLQKNAQLPAETAQT